jgi:hypothetical protein
MRGSFGVERAAEVPGPVVGAPDFPEVIDLPAKFLPSGLIMGTGTGPRHDHLRGVPVRRPDLPG